MRIKPYALTALLVLTGCADTNRVITDSAHRSRTTHVDVFKGYEQEKPSKPTRTIAELSRKGIASDELQVESYFVNEAKKLGADAISIERDEVGAHIGWGLLGGGGIDGASLSKEFLYKAKLYVYE